MDDAHAVELLFTPAIDRDIQALFLRPIADSDLAALHLLIPDQAGFHLPEADGRLPAKLAAVAAAALLPRTQSGQTLRR